MINLRLPVSVLSGYFGAAKTTLLDPILINRERLPVAVIADDMSNVNNDARRKKPCGERLDEVESMGRDMDRHAIEQAWKAMHLHCTETRKGSPGKKGRRDLPDPFPQWQRTEAGVAA